MLQNFLDGYVESVDSTYGCVLLRGRVVAATKNWLSLHPDEVNLLSLVVTTDAWATLKVRSSLDRGAQLSCLSQVA